MLLAVRRAAAPTRLRGVTLTSQLRYQSSAPPSSASSSTPPSPTAPSSSTPASATSSPSHAKARAIPPVSFSTAAARSLEHEHPKKWAPIPPTADADSDTAELSAADRLGLSSPSPSSHPPKQHSFSDFTFPPARPAPPSSFFPTILSADGIRPLRVLGLESSADDSCAAIVSGDRRILSSVVRKQHDINLQHGGIHPIKAQDAHMRDMPEAIRGALQEADLSLDDVDAIAYTRGPGMYGCLSVGATAARALAAASGKALVGVHHMQAHALTPMLTEDVPPSFPFLTLLVSGGHTQIVLAETVETYRVVGDKLDNSIGDAFDKTARLLQLPPSPTLGLGPVLEEYAAAPPIGKYATEPVKPMRFPLTKPKERNTVAFSFAGLMIQTERVAKKEFSNLKMKIPLAVQQEIARVFQEAAVGHVVEKVRLCIDTLGVPVRAVVVSGGVGSNKYLRERLRIMLDNLQAETQSQDPVTLHYPPVPLCTDNAAMIAWVAALRIQNGLVTEPFDLPLRKRWSLEELYDDVPASAFTKDAKS